jgi:uncharacterized protein (DUF1499 family)
VSWKALLLVILIVAGALTAGTVIYIRSAPTDVAVWHVDPLVAPDPGKRNDYRVLPPGMPGADEVSPVFLIPAQELETRLDAIILAEPRTGRLAGDPLAAWATYMQRSFLVGYPDYVSVRAVDVGEGRSALAIFSRSRYGYSDWGVNRARVRRWLDALADTPRA